MRTTPLDASLDSKPLFGDLIGVCLVVVLRTRSSGTEDGV